MEGAGPLVQLDRDPGLEQAQPEWLWFAAVCFVGALLCNACAWRATVAGTKTLRRVTLRFFKRPLSVPTAYMMCLPLRVL